MSTRSVHVPGGAQDGGYTAPFALLILPIVGMIGLTLDLSMAYARRAELQAVANGAALAAGRALDGTMAGLATARSRARDVAQNNVYHFKEAIAWDDAALRFAASPNAGNGDWISGASVNAGNVATMRYARVDTSALGGGQTDTAVQFARIFGTASSISQNAVAVAGRSSIQVTPLGICAIRSDAYASRPNALGAGNDELLEHGFRRGVTYNLLNLNPAGSTAASFAINPVDIPAGANHAAHLSDASLRPFLCGGTIARVSLGSGDRVYVRAPFPAAMTAELNSRFEQYAATDGCNSALFLPDYNVRNFSDSYSGWWMTSTPAPGRGSVESAIVAGALLTIGESPVTVPGTTTSSYGTLWSFAKPVRYNAALPNFAGSSFVAADWSKLYPVASGTLSSTYSNVAARPYAFGGSHRQAPSGLSVLNRRVLNVPLLSCPVSGDTATVLAIGRFLMTAPAVASPAAIHAEFGGLVTDAALGASASLYR